MYTGSSLAWSLKMELSISRQGSGSRFVIRLHCEKMLCATAGGGVEGIQGDGCRKTKWLAGKRGDNLGFLGPCQSSPADRMATAEGPCCEGGCSFLLKGKRGCKLTTPTAPEHVFLQPLLIASQGLFNSCFLKEPLSSTATHNISLSLYCLPRPHRHTHTVEQVEMLTKLQDSVLMHAKETRQGYRSSNADIYSLVDRLTCYSSWHYF